ncbi:MAG: tRNA glutamyl-Q(34) synthetase GluQRS [Methylotetracoccus sp.]
MTHPRAEGPRADRSYRGRFAPSPTGHLHLGSLFTALASYLEARARGGTWLLRIDDIDSPRCSIEATDSILRTLERFGLSWDEPPVYQHRRIARYQEALRVLDDARQLYACVCTRRKLANGGVSRAYPGTCRDTGAENRTGAHALRVRSESARIAFHDRLQGNVFQDVAREIGDFVVRRRDGLIAYHLATVVDDADAGITEVVRGQDLLESTPRQILLQRRLGLAEPAYCHVPVIIGASGLKLSKQNHAPMVDESAPGRILFSLLGLLRQRPPAELAEATAAEVLDWGTRHWSIERMAGAPTIGAEIE